MKRPKMTPAIAAVVVVMAVGVDVLLSACGLGSGPTPGPAPIPVYLTVTLSDSGVIPTTSLAPRESTGDFVLRLRDEIYVNFVNQDAEPHDIRSDPHPAHTNCPALNVETIAPGQSQLTPVLNQCVGGTTAQTFHDETRPDDPRFQGRIVRGR